MKGEKLLTYLQAFDGSAISLLSEARTACRGSACFFDDLMAHCLDPEPSISNGATWILKAELEDGASLTPAMTQTLIGSLERLRAWQAMLHVCQLVDYLELTAEQAGRMIAWARSLADHSRPFLRAWSVHVRVVLGRKFKAYQRDADAALALAENDKAASVRARARQLRKDAKR